MMNEQIYSEMFVFSLIQHWFKDKTVMFGKKLFRTKIIRRSVPVEPVAGAVRLQDLFRAECAFTSEEVAPTSKKKPLRDYCQQH